MNGRTIQFEYDPATRRDAVNGYVTGPRVVSEERPCPKCGALTDEPSPLLCSTCDRTVGVGD